MTRRYVIFFWHLFSERDWVRFGCDAMIARGYTVHIIQLGPALEGMDLSKVTRQNFNSVAQAETPESPAAVLDILDYLAPLDLILVQLPILPQYLWLRVELGRRNLRYVQLNLGRLPMGPNSKRLIRHSRSQGLIALFKSLHHLSYRVKFHLSLISQMGINYFRIPAPVLWGKSGTARNMFSTEGIHLWRSEIVELESFEIGWAKGVATHSPDVPNKAYAVYIDEAICDHPDYTTINHPAPARKETFAPSLRQLFERVERECGLKVVIALHPKANYQAEDLKWFFGDRPTFCNVTPALIRDAALVLLHNSTSVSCVVLYQKPAWFLTSDDIDRSWLRNELDSRADWLNQPVVNIDDKSRNMDSPLPEVAVDTCCYLDFEESFLRSAKAIPGPPMEIIAERYEALSPHTN